MIKFSTRALTACIAATPAIAAGDRPHSWYVDKDVPVISAVLTHQAATMATIRGIDSFEIDRTNDLVTVNAGPGWGPGAVRRVDDGD